MIFIYINYQNKALPFFLKQLFMHAPKFLFSSSAFNIIDGGGLATRELIFLVP